MIRFRPKDRKSSDGTTALADRPTSDFVGSDDELFAEIEGLTETNRATPSRDTERQLLRLRNIAGLRRLEATSGNPRHPEPDTAGLGQNGSPPEFSAEDTTPGLLRAGILRDGCLLVRGLVPRADAVHFAQQIDRCFEERERHDSGERFDDGYYSEFTPDPRFGDELARPWIKMGGGVLAVDSPMLSFKMSEMFRHAGLPELVEGYLGEPPMITAQKTTLRKADPAVAGAWHQDGKFMGQVRALNLWLSLSRCGDESPGLDIVPRRLDGFVTTQTDEALLDYAASQKMVEEAAGEQGIIRPIFEPGDALLFDDLFMHKTGSDPSMPKPRFAIENWFFGGSAFPKEYAPLAV
jgi:Phytanoyl-CoA dioxygenase (PhyH)